MDFNLRFAVFLFSAPPSEVPIAAGSVGPAGLTPPAFQLPYTASFPEISMPVPSNSDAGQGRGPPKTPFLRISASFASGVKRKPRLPRGTGQEKYAATTPASFYHIIFKNTRKLFFFWGPAPPFYSAPKPAVLRPGNFPGPGPKSMAQKIRTCPRGGGEAPRPPRSYRGR